MFNLIITIISIALVAVLAIATIYYGGQAFTQGSARANASTLVAHGQQITAANVLYANANGGTFATAASALSPTYLSTVPAAPANVAGAYTVDAANIVTATVSSQQVCNEAAKNAGIASAQGVAPSAAGTTALEALGQYGCGTDTSVTPNVMTFWYKG